MSTIPQMFLSTCRRFAGVSNKVAYAQRKGGEWVYHTHDQLLDSVAGVALGLLRMGLVPGDRIGIVSENRTEWAICNYAATCAGLVDVPVFPTLTAPQLQYIFEDSGAAAVVVSNAFQLKKILEIWPELPSLQFVVTIEAIDIEDRRVVHLDNLIEIERTHTSLEQQHDKLEQMAERVHAADVLTIIYTSGTTGEPKGVMLTHGNLVANIEAGLKRISVTDTDVFVSYLPLCHSYERMSGYYLAFFAGASVYIAESIDSVAERMREVRPTIMTSVPRLFERIRARILGSVERDSPRKQRIFHWAMAVGDEFDRGHTSPLVRLQRSLADRLVFSKIRERMGGRLRFFVSGGAALGAELGRFFRIVGIRIVEGYGLTETSPVIAVHSLNDIVLGTVGPPLDNVMVRIADDGEILVRGPSIMKGYWKNDVATKEVLTPDGWLHTGDIGEIDSNGHLRITDRKKHLLVSSGGKNIAPQPIEQLLLQSPLIDQIMLVGDAREYCTALVVPQAEVVKELLAKDPSADLHKLIEADINVLQRDLAKYERVRRFAILPEPFTIDNGMLTPTLKVKRKAVLAAYSDIIDGLYERHV